eukprot:3572846-Alexandrium_andersonii.AAC.1
MGWVQPVPAPAWTGPARRVGRWRRGRGVPRGPSALQPRPVPPAPSLGLRSMDGCHLLASRRASWPQRLTVSARKEGPSESGSKGVGRVFNVRAAQGRVCGATPHHVFNRRDLIAAA